ncbi:unnamed protein product [Ranitomeya imitator]|uniref:C2 domain-containing protein n=1 Tax=Ranitomeya imitator TaxID=111125 RepID=A0ABN9L4V8_9NEOB|nr:unnamed protein product [Ranitomeya imitator]
MDETMERYIIPEGIRPVLKEFRIEVLFWGLRDLRRINLFEVEQPQVRIECAGKIVESEVILSCKEFPNFTELVKCIDVQLPEQVYLHPPLSIFVVEKRAFGRSVMVGSAVVSHLMKFAPKELEEKSEETEDKKKKVFHRLNSQPAVINVEQEERDGKFNPLNLVKEPFKSLGKTITKDEELEEERPDPEELDWWSKYYESLRDMEDHMDAADEDDEGENEEGGDGMNINSIDAAGEEEVVEVEIVKPKRKPISTLKATFTLASRRRCVGDAAATHGKNARKRAQKRARFATRASFLTKIGRTENATCSVFLRPTLASETTHVAKKRHQNNARVPYVKHRGASPLRRRRNGDATLM